MTGHPASPGALRVLVVTNMYPTAEEPWFGCFVRDQVDDLRSLDVDVRVLHFDGRRDWLNYVRAARDVRRLVSAEPFDLVHAHYGLTGAAAQVQRRVPTLTTFHGSDYNGWSPWQRRVSWFVARGSVPILVSEAGRRALGRPSAEVIPCGVDTERFRPLDRGAARRELGWDEERPYILFPGSRSNRRKRADLFDAALEEARAEAPGLKAVALEGVSSAEAALLMNGVNVTVMTSDAEGSPVAVRESLACTTPVVSVPVGDVAEVLAGLPGCGIYPRRPHELARGVLRGLSAERSPELRRRAERYSRKRTAERLVAVYRRIVGWR